MNTFFRVIGLCNLTRDPELKYLPSGTPVANFGAAANYTYTPQGGEKKQEVCFVDVVIFGKQAEAVGQYLHKGSRACIEGRLSFRQWENDAGDKRSKLEIVADRVHFLDGKKDGNGGHAEEDGPE